MALGAGFPDRGSIEEKRIKLLELLRRCKTRLIILDEFQHLVERGTRPRIEAVADAIKTLINQSGIPIILVGHPLCPIRTGVQHAACRKISRFGHISSHLIG